MHRIALLDDEYEFLNRFSSYFAEYKDIYVDIYVDPYDLIERIDSYDAVYIDYHMPLLNAFDFFNMTKNNHYLKIIITNYDQMIFDSLQFDIFYFVRKNKLDADFPTSIKKLITELKKQINNKLTIHSYNQIISIYYSDIQFIETEKNYIIIHALKDYKIRCTFKNILSRIDNKNCIAISYGVIVNIEYVIHIDFKNMLVIMNNGKTFSLSKKYKQDVRNIYREYKLL